MNKTVKWILIGLAIALGVFVVSLPVFYMVRHAGSLASQGSGMAPFQGEMPFRSGYHMPFNSRAIMMLPLMGLFGIFRLLLPLAVVGLAVYGVVSLVRGRAGHAGVAGFQSPPPVPTMPAEARVCVSCGMALQKEGEFCPHCGAKQ